MGSRCPMPSNYFSPALPACPTCRPRRHRWASPETDFLQASRLLELRVRIRRRSNLLGCSPRKLAASCRLQNLVDGVSAAALEESDSPRDPKSRKDNAHVQALLR